MVYGQGINCMPLYTTLPCGICAQICLSLLLNLNHTSCNPYFTGCVKLDYAISTQLTLSTLYETRLDVIVIFLRLFEISEDLKNIS